MLEEEGRVIGLEEGYAIVQTERGSSCDGCHSKSSCHSMGDTEGSIMEIRAINDMGAKVGDRVKVAIDSIVFLKSSFLVYVLPLIVMITGGVIGETYAKNNMPGADADLVAGAVGITCLVISFLLIRLWSKSLEKKREYQPQIIRIIRG